MEAVVLRFKIKLFLENFPVIAKGYVLQMALFDLQI